MPAMFRASTIAITAIHGRGLAAQFSAIIERVFILTFVGFFAGGLVLARYDQRRSGNPDRATETQSATGQERVNERQ